jgi:hypothetical protein
MVSGRFKLHELTYTEVLMFFCIKTKDKILTFSMINESAFHMTIIFHIRSQAQS